MGDAELVYSTDSSVNKQCQRCKKLMVSCTCSKNSGSTNKAKINAVLRIEKAHRGGKDVTVIDKLPPDESFLADLAQTLKKKCGSGGTYKVVDNIGTIEIQGDKREQLRKELDKQDIRCR